jgi:hypothetical protein
MTIEQIILNTLNDSSDWVVSHQLEKENTKYGWIGTRGLRTCRNLEERGLIVKNKEIDKYVWYKIIQTGRDYLVGGSPRSNNPIVQDFFNKHCTPKKETITNKLF